MRSRRRWSGLVWQILCETKCSTLPRTPRLSLLDKVVANYIVLQGVYIHVLLVLLHNITQGLWATSGGEHRKKSISPTHSEPQVYRQEPRKWCTLRNHWIIQGGPSFYKIRSLEIYICIYELYRWSRQPSLLSNNMYSILLMYDGYLQPGIRRRQYSEGKVVFKGVVWKYRGRKESSFNFVYSFSSIPNSSTNTFFVCSLRSGPAHLVSLFHPSIPGKTLGIFTFHPVPSPPTQTSSTVPLAFKCSISIISLTELTLPTGTPAAIIACEVGAGYGVHEFGVEGIAVNADDDVGWGEGEGEGREG